MFEKDIRENSIVDLPSSLVLDAQSTESDNRPARKRHFLVFILISITLLLVILTGSYLSNLARDKSKLSELSNQKLGQDVTLNPSSSISDASNSSTTVLATNRVAGDPQENSIYLGLYDNENALFITDKEKQVYYENGMPRSSPKIGELTVSGGGYKPFDFNNLSNTKLLYSASEKPIDSIVSFILNTSENLAWISITYQDPSYGVSGLLNTILQVSTDGSMAKEVWSNVIGSSKYTNAGGATYLEQVLADKFIVFSIGNCYGCSGGPVGTIIVNTTSGNEKYYEMIGDVQLFLESNTMTYKKLAPVQEDCSEPSPVCVDGKTTDMRPSGQQFKDSLP